MIERWGNLEETKGIADGMEQIWLRREHSKQETKSPFLVIQINFTGTMLWTNENCNKTYRDYTKIDVKLLVI